MAPNTLTASAGKNRGSHPDRGTRGRRLAQVILGLGQDRLRLPRGAAQAPAQFGQVLLDQVAGTHGPVHADHPAAVWAGQPSTDCTPRSNARH